MKHRCSVGRLGELSRDGVLHCLTQGDIEWVVDENTITKNKSEKKALQMKFTRFEMQHQRNLQRNVFMRIIYSRFYP